MQELSATNLGEEAVPGLPVLRVELELARTREMVLTDEDALDAGPA